ncbi:MAG: TIGR03936 family radical SAM-associated protein [Treponema sp.]|nr:TIGR03936 family radical SAM-associated protein [Treponema sp.]
MTKKYIEPLKVLGGRLLEVDKPARYVGGEVGILAKKDADFQTLIAFPDLYEIGMGNQALRILYNILNNKQGISCDRAFAPAPDFEKLLRDNNIPLYGLDTGISLSSVDLLMFTLGYELGLNGILTMLDVSGIPIHCDKRNENHPVIITGGPAVSNPLPYSPFIDAFWIGEAEAGFFDLVNELADLKKRGQGRAALLEKLFLHPNVWLKGKPKTERAIYTDFSQSDTYVYPVPSMKIIQNHGTIEIMRGCPNGCRFCHAGFWYRPSRQKDIENILEQTDKIITKGGWQQISLSSLSSGDYNGIGELIELLNNQFSDKHVSFQLPSLKVSSFSLSLLDKISVTRKSGLTFAVETPKDYWQMSINKEVTCDSVVSILDEARRNGWKGAKFYFMIGLPVQSENSENEEEAIVSFIEEVAKRTRMVFNINISVFVPKPHTPYQYAVQINNNEAERKLSYLRSKLKPMGHKVSTSDLLISQIEGLLSRGDEKAGLLCELAWKAGSRLDPWSEYIKKEVWQELLLEYNGENEISWNNINSCVNKEYLDNELEKSKNRQRTLSCKEKCNSCGACKGTIYPQVIPKKAVNLNKLKVNHNKNNNINEVNRTDPSIYRVIFSFSKSGSSVFHGHLSLIEIFSMSFKRAGLPVNYTQGYNPLIKMEFASPLSVGINAAYEFAAVDFYEDVNIDNFISRLNSSLPRGIIIEKAECFYIKSGMKKHSLSSLLWGFEYEGKNGALDYVSFKDEKTYRKSRLENDCKTVYDLKRNVVLAKNITGSGESEYISYFKVYNFLYNN